MVEALTSSSVTEIRKTINQLRNGEAPAITKYIVSKGNEKESKPQTLKIPRKYEAELT